MKPFGSPNLKVSSGLARENTIRHKKVILVNVLLIKPLNGLLEGKMPQKGNQDKVNKELLQRISENPALPAIDIIKPHTGNLSEVALRRRLDILERDGFIKADREKVPGRVYFRILDKGISELENSVTQDEEA
jgi:hypothetical protein